MAKVTAHKIETTVSSTVPRLLPRQVRVAFNYRHHDRTVHYTGCEAHVSGTAGPKKWEAPHPAIAASAEAWLAEHTASASKLAREEIAEQKQREKASAA